MKIVLNTLGFPILLLFLLLTPFVQAADCIDGPQVNGGVFRICMPPLSEYNGRLVIWAHGFQDAGTPVEIPEDQLQIGGLYLPDLITNLGFAFATNSYRKTGLAIAQGSEDIVDLVEVFIAEQGQPIQTYVIGASEGGIITALLAEQRPDLFGAALAACGPIGSFPGQIAYFGDARVLFEVCFPGLIPGGPFDPLPGVVDNWQSFYETEVKPVVFDPANRSLLDQFVTTAKLPFDSGSEQEYLTTVEISVADVLRYAVLNLGDAANTLGGFPYGNLYRWFSGSQNDALLNALVGATGGRVAADPVALAEMRSSRYSTSGQLDIPLVTPHTTRDQQVPYWHEPLYALKTLRAGDLLTNHFPLRIDRFGHCNFTLGEALAGFILMLDRAGELGLLTGVGAQLNEADLLRFEALARDHGLEYQIEGTRLRYRINEPLEP
ncbi:MAG: alpha/beta hydrolase family protein [Methylococcales bacterium]